MRRSIGLVICLSRAGYNNILIGPNLRNPHASQIERKGKLFEDLDALAGNVAFVHCERDGKVPLLVTASVDRIRLRHNPLLLDRDMGKRV